MNIERSIAKYIDDHALIRKRIAIELGMHPQSFSQVLNGRRRISAEELVKFARIVEKPVEEIVTYGEEEEVR